MDETTFSKSVQGLIRQKVKENKFPMFKKQLKQMVVSIKDGDFELSLKMDEDYNKRSKKELQEYAKQVVMELRQAVDIPESAPTDVFEIQWSSLFCLQLFKSGCNWKFRGKTIKNTTLGRHFRQAVQSVFHRDNSI